MKNGIGPQNLGASGMSTKSKPCGTPLDFNDSLRAALPEIKKDNPNFAAAIEADSSSPIPFQDDITKIQEAAGVLEAHNITGGGGGAPAGDIRAQQTNMVMDSMGGGNAPGTGSMTLGGNLDGRFTKGAFGARMLAKRRR
tara:strand:+ start:805 stop:1224 length:420 start_codon:yes stop_codon:yes gene_type:complete